MKDKLTILCILGPMLLFCILGIMKPADELSLEERRKLEQVPNFSVESILNNSYFSKWTDYLTDQFPYRTFFRQLKGTVSLNLFQKIEENNVIQIDNSLYELNPTINEDSINHFTELLQETLGKYNYSSHVYYSIIPDKIYYVDDSQIPKLDYEKLVSQVQTVFQNYSYISLFEELNKDSYYQTDIHWKQSALQDVVQKLKTEMQLPTSNYSWTKQEVTPFYGALKSRIPNNIKAETITYYTNDIIEEASVFNYEHQQFEKVYQKENIHHLDGYDVFLSGASSLLFIENKMATTNRELIVFRDSFASSLLPLFIPDYQKITVIDLRYITSDYLENLEEINWQDTTDILLLYSIPIINNSFTLK